jgi:hypothetical protein
VLLVLQAELSGVVPDLALDVALDDLRLMRVLRGISDAVREEALVVDADTLCDDESMRGYRLADELTNLWPVLLERKAHIDSR